MAILHYGEKAFDITNESAAQVIKSIGGRASGSGGWVAFTDQDGADWAILVTNGIPICIDAHPQRREQVIPRRIR